MSATPHAGKPVAAIGGASHARAGQAACGTDDLLPTRRSLLGRLHDWRDDHSWQEFFETYWRLIYNVACKSGLSPAEAEEVVQETVISVAKAMRDFGYEPARGSFKGWLLQLTGWRITNQFKKRSRRDPLAADVLGEGGGIPDGTAMEPAVPPELQQLWDAEWEENLVHSAIEKVRQRASPKHFQIFNLSVVQEKSVKEIRELLDVNPAEVYLARHRIGRLIRKETDRLRRQLE